MPIVCRVALLRQIGDDVRMSHSQLRRADHAAGACRLSREVCSRAYSAGLVACLALALPIPRALAAANDQAAFFRVLADPVEQREVIAAAARSQVMVQHPCAEARVRIEPAYVPVVQPTLDESGAVVAGAWKQIVSEQGCDESHALNVLVTMEAGKRSMAALLPGETHAGPVLQRDAVPFAAQLLATIPGFREPDCKVLFVSETKYVGTSGEALPNSKGPAWKELWTLETCKQVAVVPMTFIPDATGTSISAGPGNAVQVTPRSK